MAFLYFIRHIISYLVGKFFTVFNYPNIVVGGNAPAFKLFKISEMGGTYLIKKCSDEKDYYFG